MNENVFDMLIEDLAKRDFAEYDNASEHVFSKRHERAMKRIFKLYEKNAGKLRLVKAPEQKKCRFSRKTVLTAVIIVFLAALAGCTAAHFISQSFRGDMHSDYTRVFPTDTENCPNTIEEKYYLSELPEGFEILETDSTPIDRYISFENKQTKQKIVFKQMIKTDFGTTHFNTEHFQIEEVDINGHIGLCIDFSNSERTHTLLLWDNGDYALEVSADLTKNELLNLAKSAKVLEN